jgi:hypothetical protein
MSWNYFRCGTKIHRPTYDTSPTNLSKHVASCLKRERKLVENHKLADLGVSGTGDINPREVPQMCAIWCAKTACPFFALGEDSHQAIMHPIVAKHLPTQKAVSNNIAQLYTAVQESLIESFKVRFSFNGLCKSFNMLIILFYFYFSFFRTIRVPCTSGLMRGSPLMGLIY